MLSGEVAVVTGAAQGLGAAIADALDAARSFLFEATRIPV